MTLKDLAVKHDYYASDSNYYSESTTSTYDSWKEFYSINKDYDIDMNLVYRWDINQDDDGEYSMLLVIIGQRKGLYRPVIINNILEENVEQIKEFLKPHFEKLISIWKPLSTEFLTK